MNGRADKLNKLLNEMEIKSLLVRERYYRDTCQWENLRQCYHADPTKTLIDISWFTGDIDGFVSGSRAMSSGGLGATHTINPVEIHMRGDKALSESTGSIQIRTKYEGEDYDLISCNRFISRLLKTADGWRMLTLDAIYDRDSLVPVLPGQKAVAKIDNLGPRASYRCVSWVLSKQGFKIKQDLPGSDRPELVTKLMDEGFSWLCC